MGGVGSCMEDAELSGGTERLICLAKMLDLNVIVGKEFFWPTLERGTLIT